LHRQIVARGFRIVGGVLGLPAFAVLAWIGTDLFFLSRTPAPAPSQPLDIKTYGLVALLSYGAKGLGAMLMFLTAIGIALAIAAAVALFLAVLLCLLLYFTGRGIARHAAWARVMGILVSAGLLLLGIAALNLSPREGIPIACVSTGVSLYVLWVLGWRFA
jgi:hypothetical protein